MTWAPRLAVAVAALTSLAAADMTNVQQVGEALLAGSKATNARGRAAAAEMLATLGAAPAEGQEDLATAWRKGRKGMLPAAYRDRVLGPVYHGLTLDAGAAARFEQSFYAGRTAYVAVVSVDRAPVALQIIDDEGKARCAGTATTCEWVPPWTARVRVEVQNKGARRGKFFVIIQ